MDTRLLVMCPSRGRPDRIKEMLASFDATRSPGTEMVIYLNENDPALPEYQKVLDGRRAYMIGPYQYIVQVFNFLSGLCPAPYYGEINDDHVYRTKGWDRRLIAEIETKGKGWGYACGQDLMHNWPEHKLMSGLVVSGNIIRTMGCFVYPKLRHTWCDNYFKDLGEGIGRYFYVPEVVIEHKHVIAGKAGMDENYRFSTGQEEFLFGKAVYEQWADTQRESDIGRLKRAIGSDY